MAKLIIITPALLAASTEDLVKAIQENAKDVASDLIILVQENESLQCQINENAEKLNDLSNGYNQLLEINKELEEQLNAIPGSPASSENEAPKKLELSKEKFTVNGKKYGFEYPAIKLDGVLVTNADVLADKNLQVKLVEMGSGFIKLV